MASEIMITVLAAVMALTAAALGKSLRETLYSYKNILLSGVVLFSGILLVTTAVWMLTAGNMKKTGLEFLRFACEFPRKFSYAAVFVMSVICLLLAVSNAALLRHEGFHLHNALSLVLAVLYIGGTLAVYLLTGILDRSVFTPEACEKSRLLLVMKTTVPMFLLLCLCYFECVFAGCLFTGWLAARQKPSHDKDFIIILGCSIDKRGGLLPLLKGRVNRAVRFAWEQEIESGKPLRYVPSGGQGPGEIMSEGSAMEFYLLTHGAEEQEVFPEKRSRNTWENMVFSKEIIDRIAPGAKIAFATTNYHMLRSGMLARRAGIDAEGIAAETKWYFWPNGFVREFIGILVMNKKAHVLAVAAILLLCICSGAAF